MTWEELEKAMEEFHKGLQEVRDQQLVTARLMEKHERESNARFERIEELALHHQELILRHEERFGELESAMQKLFEHLDQFIRGQQGNGQKGQQSDS